VLEFRLRSGVQVAWMPGMLGIGLLQAGNWIAYDGTFLSRIEDLMLSCYPALRDCMPEAAGKRMN
jgi:hypothetical protein